MLHKFKIGDKVLISNNFYVGKNPKLAPTYTGPGKIIDINDTNAKVKLNNKIKILNVNKLKLFLQENDSDQQQTFLGYDFNEASSDKPLTCAHSKLFNHKNAAQLALLMLNEEGGSSDLKQCDSMCNGPCPGCDTENDYFKANPPQRNFTQKCNSCEEFKKLFLKLKEREEQCHQLRQQINFARQHRLHQINQIKSVDTKLKTGIAESLREPLMKIAQHLLISDKNSFEQLTPTESSPHSSPTPSTSGTRPKSTPLSKTQHSQPDASGTSTSGTTPQPPAAKAHNLRQRSKVDYKDLNTSASQFGRAEFRKRCSKAGASVRKSMSLAELFPPISRNSSSSSMASSKNPDLIWKKCFSTPQSPETPTPVPSAPPMPIPNQPQIHRATPATNNQATKSNASIPIHINIS